MCRHPLPLDTFRNLLEPPHSPDSVTKLPCTTFSVPLFLLDDRVGSGFTWKEWSPEISGKGDLWTQTPEVLGLGERNG